MARGNGFSSNRSLHKRIWICENVMPTETVPEMSRCCNPWDTRTSSIPFGAWDALRGGMGGRSFDGRSRLMKITCNGVLISRTSSTYPRGYACGLIRDCFDQPEH